MKILYCDCARRDYVSVYNKQIIRSALAEAEIEVLATQDLCRMAVHEREVLRRFFATGKVAVIACDSRAVKSLLEYCEIDYSTMQIDFYNLRTHNPVEILDALGIEKSGGEQISFADSSESEQDNWLPWYPVIDRERCTACGKCFNFCLFGVYEKDANNQIVVRNPEKCKPECPACARVCPQGAVIFPKHKEAEINGGAVVTCAVDDEENDSPATDDMYSLLKKRREMHKINLFKKDSEK